MGVIHHHHHRGELDMLVTLLVVWPFKATYLMLRWLVAAEILINGYVYLGCAWLVAATGVTSLTTARVESQTRAFNAWIRRHI